MSENPASQAVTGEDEVAAICSDLIRIDTSNRGDHSGPGERQAAEHVAALLAEVGLEPAILESHPGRASVGAAPQEERFSMLSGKRPDCVVAPRPSASISAASAIPLFSLLSMLLCPI